MKLRYYYILLALLIALGCIGLILVLDTRQSEVLYVAEGYFLLMVIYLIVFYRKVMSPIDTLSGGLDMLRSQDFNSTLRHVGQKEVDMIADTFNFMLDRLRSQRIRFEEQAYPLRQLIHHSPSGVIILDPTGKVVVANPSSGRFIGHDVVAGSILGNSPSTLARKLSEDMSQDNSRILRMTDGNVVRYSSHSFINTGITYRFYIIDNVTDEILQSERNGYEKVIRTMSHEVNNSVAGMLSALETIKGMAEYDDTMTDLIPILQSCSDRARSMSNFISRYAEVIKIPEPVMADVDITSFLLRNKLFLQGIASGFGVRFEMNLPTESYTIKADIVLLEQVLVNIIKNSAESVVASNRSDGLVSVDAKSAGSEVIITVTDNGVGISEQNRYRIFTPFFSDKPNGQGIGLMTVREILRKHDCRFSLGTSPDDKLTRFVIRFSR